MKKSRKNAGFSLIELICTLLILVLLVMGIGVGMDTGSRIYRDATFEADSAAMAGIVNNSLSDMLRFSIVTATEGMRNLPDAADFDPMETPYVFTSLEYGVQYAYFILSQEGVLQLRTIKSTQGVELVNSGTYPELEIQHFVIHYEPRRNPGVEGGYFEVSYDIVSKNDPTKIREVTMIVRQMND